MNREEGSLRRVPSSRILIMEETEVEEVQVAVEKERVKMMPYFLVPSSRRRILTVWMTLAVKPAGPSVMI